MGHRTKRFISRTILSHATLGALLVLTVLFFTAGAAAQADDSSTLKTIKVIMDDNYPPYVFRNEKGQLQGILIDQWKLWEEKVGVRAELTGMNWAEAQQGMRSGEFDVIDTLFRNDHREKIYDFSKPSAPIDVPLYFHYDISGIRGVQDLKGFVVAAKKGDNVIEILHQGGITNIVEYPSYEMIIEAAQSGKIKVFTVDKPAALYFLNKAGIQDLFRESPPLYTGYFHRAVLKGNSQILATVEKGFSLISEKEYRAIDSLWMGMPISFTPYFRYFIYILAVGMAVLLMMGTWLWMLKLAVTRKTGELTRKIKLRKLSEEAVLSSEAHLKTLIKTIPDLVWLKDPDGMYLACNEKFERFFGARETEIVGRTDYDFVDKKLADFFRQHDKAAMAAGKPCVNEEELVFADDGHLELVETIKTPMFGSKGQLMGVLGIARDITERTRSEEDRKKMIAQLRQAQKMEAIGTLAGGIAHDFNNILAIIIGYTDLAKDDAPPDSKIVGDLEKVLEAGNRAKDLVKQILTFSRQAEIERIPTHLHPLINETVKMLRSSIPTSIAIQADIDATCGVVLADPTHVHQILMNLCTNANHAMEESGGILKIELKKVLFDEGNRQMGLHITPGQYVELMVSDTGTGIGPDLIDKIFDPYFTTKQLGKGTGMGLAIIHGIIADYGGSITVESELGKGTTFHVYFPVVEQEELPFVEDGEEIPSGKERILFIDDEELLTELGQDMLERLGYNVTIRRSSLEALSTFQNNPDAFDAVITDQTMPGMTGADLARRMLQIRPNIPIILCTGYSTQIDAETAKSLGIKEFALKPLVKGTLAKLLRKVLDAS
ncbi:MAG: transporter substrate-binding domain-containing protein [Proteobacteria bacterium]|nr:transporter substrate-binding domain-containing protein [Pseudomonadota bacterium]MBU1711422.1 transporter substrate-binding domain-containing protein [Pseudomonadota bacterium]